MTDQKYTPGERVMPVARDTPIMMCRCGSTDFIQRPSGEIICVVCGRPFAESIQKAERP